MKRFYLTTPIYYASGKPHLGHAFTTIYADVIARYKRNDGFEVFFSTGMDEHGAKIAEKAKNEKKNPQAYVDELAKVYLDNWKKLEISFDEFIRTSSPQHEKSVLEFIKRIYEKGDLYEANYEGLYCVGCEGFIDKDKLVNGLCPDHLIQPELVKEKNYFFNLKKYLPVVKEKIITGEILIVPEARKNEILKMIDENIPDFSITREKVKWGIPFPYDKNQTVYVWVDALVNYLSAVGFPDNKFKDFWPADLHIIGAEINKFHSIFWPAMLLSANLPLPRKIFVHGLFTVNGQKMSKTLGNVIDPNIIFEKFGEAVRYLVLSQFPAEFHGDIKENDFLEKYNSDLADGVGNTFERIAALIYPEKSLLIEGIVDKPLEPSLEKLRISYRQHMENYELFNALHDVLNFTKDVDRYINLEKPWTITDNGKKKLVLSSLNSAVKEIIYSLEPFLPTKMDLAKSYFADILNNSNLSERKKLGLFPKLK